MDNYILHWCDGDGSTYKFDVIQPFFTDDIDLWKYNLILQSQKAIKHNDLQFEYNGIKLPVTSSQFEYTIIELSTLINKTTLNLNKVTDTYISNFIQSKDIFLKHTVFLTQTKTAFIKKNNWNKLIHGFRILELN